MRQAEPEKQSAFATEPVGRLIVKFAVPSVIALLVNSLYNIVDQIFIGWGVGYLGNGATNIVFPIRIPAARTRGKGWRKENGKNPVCLPRQDLLFRIKSLKSS